MWKALKQNPEWKKYNDFMNEGGEGYNPHEKMIPSTKKYMTIFNKEMTVEDARDMLAKLESSLSKHTEERKIEGCKNCITILQNQLKFAY